MNHQDWGLFEFALTALGIAILISYCFAARRLRSQGQKWSLWRQASFVSGVLLLVIAMLPGVVTFAHHDLRGHMLQHLLLGMFAPLGLVFGAPVTLALQSSSRGVARLLVAILKTRLVRVASHPLPAMILNIGGMYVLYLTPLYQAMLDHYWLHALVHWHFLVAGCLFTWAIAGPDPAPNRPEYPGRLVILFVAIAAHAFLAKAMYAYGWPAGGVHLPEEIKAAAKLMYYGGDLAELLLVVALFQGWLTPQVRLRMSTGPTRLKHLKG